MNLEETVEKIKEDLWEYWQQEPNREELWESILDECEYFSRDAGNCELRLAGHIEEAFEACVKYAVEPCDIYELTFRLLLSYEEEIREHVMMKFEVDYES